MCFRSFGADTNGHLTSWAIVVAGFAAIIMSIAPSHAIGLPFEYHSTDRSEIEVNLGVVRVDETGKKLIIGHHHPKTKDFVESVPTQTINIPRAYIRLAHPYSRKRKMDHPATCYKVLPERVFADSLSLVLSYPDGIPYTILDADWPQRRPDMTQPLIGNTAFATSFKNQKKAVANPC